MTDKLPEGLNELVKRIAADHAKQIQEQIFTVAEHLFVGQDPVVVMLPETRPDFSLAETQGDTLTVRYVPTGRQVRYTVPRRVLEVYMAGEPVTAAIPTEVASAADSS